jgi:hypothetical protein
MYVDDSDSDEEDEDDEDDEDDGDSKNKDGAQRDGGQTPRQEDPRSGNRGSEGGRADGNGAAADQGGPTPGPSDVAGASSPGDKDEEKANFNPATSAVKGGAASPQNAPGASLADGGVAYPQLPILSNWMRFTVLGEGVPIMKPNITFFHEDLSENFYSTFHGLRGAACLIYWPH